jgi:hypothetical protein
MKKQIVRTMDNFEFTLRRRLRFRIKDKVAAGDLVIGNLRKVRTRGKADAWACSWSLSETDPKPRDIYGEDALGAVVNCLVFLNSYVQNKAEAGIEIWWIEKGDNAGLRWAFVENGKGA